MCICVYIYIIIDYVYIYLAALGNRLYGFDFTVLENNIENKNAFWKQNLEAHFKNNHTI